MSYIKKVVVGTPDYHTVMREICFSLLPLDKQAPMGLEFDSPFWRVDNINSENRCLFTNKILKRVRVYYLYLISSEPICHYCITMMIRIWYHGYSQREVGVFLDGNFSYGDFCCLCGADYFNQREWVNI